MSWATCSQILCTSSTFSGKKARPPEAAAICSRALRKIDRKSTRLNSSHQIISYAVFCLKKKKKRQHSTQKMSKLSLAHWKGDAADAYARFLSVGMAVVCSDRGGGWGVWESDACRAVVYAVSTHVLIVTMLLRLASYSSLLIVWLQVCSNLYYYIMLCCSYDMLSHLTYILLPPSSFFFFLNDPAPPEIYPLPLPDPLPIFPGDGVGPPATTSPTVLAYTGNHNITATNNVMVTATLTPSATANAIGIAVAELVAIGASV